MNFVAVSCFFSNLTDALDGWHVCTLRRDGFSRSHKLAKDRMTAVGCRVKFNLEFDELIHPFILRLCPFQ